MGESSEPRLDFIQDFTLRSKISIITESQNKGLCAFWQVGALTRQILFGNGLPNKTEKAFSLQGCGDLL